MTYPPIRMRWCSTCERWFHRSDHDCAAWVRPVNWRIFNDGMKDGSRGAA